MSRRARQRRDCWAGKRWEADGNSSSAATLPADDLLLAELVGRARATGEIARSLGLSAYSDGRAALRPALVDLKRRGLVRLSPRTDHGVWSLTPKGEAAAAGPE